MNAVHACLEKNCYKTSSIDMTVVIIEKNLLFIPSVVKKP